MTVYVDNPFRGLGGGMRNPTPYGGGIAGGLMNRPPPFMPQQPMPQMPMDETIYTPRMPQGPQGPRMPQFPIPQMPRRMPGGPSKGGNTTPPPIQGPMRGPQMPMPRPPMQRPGGPGKARTGPRGGLMRRGRGSLMRGGPGKGRGQPQQPMPQPSGGFFLGNMLNNAMSQGQIGQPQQSFMGRVGNNMPQPPMDFPQPTARPVNQTMGRPMPQPNFTLGPMNRGGFYSGCITDLY